MTAFTDQLKTDLVETFFNAKEFAEVVTMVPASGPAYSMDAIFDNEYRSIDPDTQEPIISTQPNLLINESSLVAAIKPNDKFIVRGKTYKVISPQTDGVGTIRILMHELV